MCARLVSIHSINLMFRTGSQALLMFAQCWMASLEFSNFEVDHQTSIPEQVVIAQTPFVRNA